LTALAHLSGKLPKPPAFVILAAVLATVGTPATPSADPVAATNAGGPRSDRFGIFDVSSDRRTVETLDRLGVGWVRVQRQMGEAGGARRIDRIASMAGILAERGIGLWLTVYHRDSTNILDAGTVGYANATRGGFPPRDGAVYQERLKRGVGRIVEAHHAAGRDPGRWLVVQIGNEVLPRDVYPPDRKVRFWHGTAEQYLWTLSLGYAAVKAIDPAIPVAAAGISSAALEAIGRDQRRIAAWNERLLTRGRFDWADVHLRHAITDIPAKMRWVRQFWSDPVAATEMAGPDPRTEPYSEALQADDLVERLRTARSSGVDRLFWASLVENPHVARVHRREGLIERGTWRLKPAFDAYQHLIETSGE